MSFYPHVIHASHWYLIEYGDEWLLTVLANLCNQNVPKLVRLVSELAYKWILTIPSLSSKVD